MHRFTKIIITFVCLIGFSAQADEPVPQTLNELKTTIEKIRRDTNTPAVGIALVNKDGPYWIAGLGETNIETHTKADENTLFRIGSVSKMIVALAALQLIDKGKLSLDDKLSTLAPEIEFYNPWETEHPIKIVHLLEHTTGWDNTHPKELTLNVDANTPLLDILCFHPHSRQSRWQPGTRMAYNNIGPVVIAYLIEKISGQSFSHYVRESIFIPLGMQKTHYFPNEIINFTQTTPYIQGSAKEYIYDSTWPSGALMSSPHDMAMLLQYFIGSKRDSLSINQTLISRMEKPGSTLGAQRGMKTGYGLGSYTSSHVNSPVIFYGHRGTIPGSLTEFFYSAEINAGYAFMMNDMNPAYTKISALIRNYLLEQHYASKTKKLEKTRHNDEKNIHIKSSLAGIYAPISPSSSYANFGEQLFGMIEIRNDENQWLQRPLLGGKTIFYTPISDQLFINKETGLDGMIVINDPLKGEILEINGYTGNSAYQQVSPLRAYGQWIVIFLIIISFIIFFISFPISGLRKLLRNSDNSAFSAITLSILSPLTLIAYYYLSNMIPYNMQIFGKPGLLSISLLLLSLIWPIMIGYTIYRYFFTPLYQINIFLRVNSAILFSSQAVLCIIMLNYGLIAMPTWL